MNADKARKRYQAFKRTRFVNEAESRTQREVWHKYTRQFHS